MFFDTILPLVSLGIALGLLSSILSVGGACLMLPILGFIFVNHGIEADIAQRMALGTSLGCILITAFSAVIAHMRHGSMRWDRWRWMTPFVIMGSLIGSWLASSCSALTLKICYAIFICAMARPVFSLPKPRHIPHAQLMLPLAGLCIGVISGLVGVAGSMFCTVFLVCTGLTWVEAVCTGSALSLPISAAGAIGFIMHGIGVPGVPETAIGYLHVPALFCVVIPAICSAWIGTKLVYSHTFPIDLWRKAFAVGSVLLALGNIFVS